MKKILLLTVCFACFYNLQAQIKTSSRIQNQIKEEKKIERYIQENFERAKPTRYIAAYNKQLNNANPEEYAELTSVPYEEKIKQFKKQYLIEQYFAENPSALEIYEAIPHSICDGGDFDDENFGDMYQGFTGIYTGGECDAISTNSTGGINFAADIGFLGSHSSHFALVSNTIDPEVGAALDPTNGSQAAVRINAPANNGNGGINKLIKRVILPQDGIQSISFDYALVAEYPDHLNQNPFFIARAVNHDQDEFDRICIISNPSNNPFFDSIPPSSNPTRSTILWQDWTCGSLEVSGNQGDLIDLEFIVSDCGLTAHFGYAYIDNICTGVCDNSSNNGMGFIDLDEIAPCQSLPFEVTGSIIEPQLDGQTGVLSSLTLDVIGQGGGTSTSYTLNGTDFSFTIDSNNGTLPANPSGGYDFQVTAVYNIPGEGNVTLSDINTNPLQNNDYIAEDIDANFTAGIDNNQNLKIINPAFEYYQNLNVTHEWYVLSSTSPSGGNYTPVNSLEANGPIPPEIILYDNAQSGMYYTVIHQVISECGTDCVSKVYYYSGSSSRNTFLDPTQEHRQNDCCLAFEFWPNGAGEDPSDFTAQFNIAINLAGMIQAQPNSAYTNNPNISHKWHLYSSTNSTGGPFILEDAQQGLSSEYSYGPVEDGLYYFLLHSVEGDCGKTCYVQNIGRNVERPINARTSGLHGEIDCDYFSCHGKAPENVSASLTKEYIDGSHEYTIHWEPSTTNLNSNYVVSVIYNDSSCNCNSIASEREQTYTNYFYSDGFYNLRLRTRYSCFSFKVGALCGDDGAIEWSGTKCIGGIVKWPPKLTPKTFVSPNPTNDFVTMSFESKNSKLQNISIVDMNGNRKFSFSVKNYEEEKTSLQKKVGDLLKSGVYFVYFTTNKGEKVIEKLIIN